MTCILWRSLCCHVALLVCYKRSLSISHYICACPPLVPLTYYPTYIFSPVQSYIRGSLCCRVSLSLLPALGTNLLFYSYYYCVLTGENQSYKIHINSVSLWQTRRSERSLRVFAPAMWTQILSKKLVDCCVLSIALYGAAGWALQKIGEKCLERFILWGWRRTEEIIWTDRVRNEEEFNNLFILPTIALYNNTLKINTYNG